MKLTYKQEQFVQNRLKGMTQRDAYINAGYSNNKLPAIIDTNASILANSTKILLRVAELNEATESKLVADVKERKQRLTVFIRENLYSKFGINRVANIQAVTELNKMERIYGEQAPAGDIVQNFVFVLPDGTKVLPGEFKKPVRELTSGNSDH